MDTGVATMEAENNEVLNSSGSRGRVQWRLGGYAQVQRVVRTRRECPGVITAAHWKRSARGLDDGATRVVGLAALRDGALAMSLRSLPNAAKGDRDGCRSPRRGQDRQRATMCQIYGVLESARKDSGHDLTALVSLCGTVERLALETTKKQLREYTEKRQGAGSTAVPTTSTTCRSRFGPPCCKPFVQSDRARGGKGAKPKDGGASSDFVAISIVLAPITRVIASRNVFKSKWVASAL